MLVKIDKKKKGVYLKVETISKLDEMKARHGLSHNQIIERALKNEFKSLEKLEPVT